MTSCSAQSRLQTGIQGAFGKPQHAVARVHTGQVITSIRTKLQNKEQVIKAHTGPSSSFWAPEDPHLQVDESEDMVAEKWIILDDYGSNTSLIVGPLDKRQTLHS
ncbi:hypothetical protein DBR06_SOUSAS21110014 [Sousa chinensis]|nr:hypothetical protein DBR06_SOUSAS21110014 [Sousa chinensis]